MTKTSACAARSPASEVKTVNARKLWQKILELRIQTGEPYLLFTDTVNNAMPATSAS
jgi:ribonucleoside-diphosphate reductase alpha chain